MINFTKKVLAQALDSSPSPTVIVDALKKGLPVVYLNQAVRQLTGKDAAEIVGKPLSDLLAEGSLPETTDGGATGPVLRSDFSDRQKWHIRDGISVPLDVRISPLYARPGQPSFWMLCVVGDGIPSVERQTHDTAALRSELVDARRQIKSLQRIDHVTGLPNQGVFDEVLERDWSIARREQRRIGVIVFSVDCLAEYREIFGRHATDSLLRKIGHAITGTLRRAGDFSARIDNDRFAVLICDADEGQIETCAKRIAVKVRNLAVHHPRSTVARFTTVSCGMASEVPAWTKPSMTLLDQARRQLETPGQVAEERQEATASSSDSEEFIS